MTLTLAHGGRCRPCREVWHFLCWARPDAAWPASCGCGCRDENGMTTEAAWLEAARRAPEQLAWHLRVQESGLPVDSLASVEAVASQTPTQDHRED